jgi:small-conductance mechanosensitive channel
VSDYLNALLTEVKSIDPGAIFSASGILTSVVFLVVVWLARRVAIKYIWRDAEVLSKDQRSWIIRIKNFSAIIVMLGLILIWAPQLHTFALSLAAFAVAVVVATKEMILCVMGAIVRVTTTPFRSGDWITIDGTTGEVVDIDAFSFRLQEVDMKGKSYQFTGRTVSIPNSKLFSTNVENANFFKSYVFEDVRIAVTHPDIDPAAAMQKLREISQRYFAPYHSEATVFNRKIRRRSGVSIGTAEPVFDISTSDIGNYFFQVKMFLPTIAAASVRADITHDFLNYIQTYRRALNSKKNEKPEEKPTAEEAE